jgi:hypothetical protein
MLSARPFYPTKRLAQRYFPRNTYNWSILGCSSFQISLSVVVIAGNVLALILPLSSIGEAWIRAGQLAVINVFLLLLCSLRHMPLSIMLHWRRPDMLWVHCLLAVVFAAECSFHAMVRFYRSRKKMGSKPSEWQAIVVGAIGLVLLLASSKRSLRHKPEFNNKYWRRAHLVLTLQFLVACSLHLTGSRWTLILVSLSALLHVLATPYTY